MSNNMFQGKRVLITQADAFMGPVLCEVFAAHGASVIASTQALVDPAAPAAAVAAAGAIDILVASLEADTEVQEAWALEAERRDVEVDAGRVKLVPGKEVLARLGAQLQ